MNSASMNLRAKREMLRNKLKEQYDRWLYEKTIFASREQRDEELFVAKALLELHAIQSDIKVRHREKLGFVGSELRVKDVKESKTILKSETHSENMKKLYPRKCFNCGNYFWHYGHHSKIITHDNENILHKCEFQS